MTFRWKRGQTIIAILCVMLVVITTACGGGDDDDDDADTTTATVTTAASSSNSTPTTADDEDESDATPTEADATPTEADASPTSAQATSTSQATATEADTEDPTATATATTSGGSTATEPAGATETTTGDGTAEVPEFETLDPELLPNFSFRMNFTALNYGGLPESIVEMEIQQSSVDANYIWMVSDGEEIELWTVDGQSWMGAGGEIIESPGGAIFTPADMLTTGEVIPAGLNAQRDGTETVNGRETTRWIVDGEDYVRYMGEELERQGTPMEMSDGTGQVIVWVDNELNIMLKAEGDVAWTNGDGTEGSIVYEYEIFDIGTTAEVTAPQ